MWEFFRFALAWLLAIPAGLAIAAALLFVGVIGLALWAGWSRNRDLERRDWKDVSRW